MELSYYDQLVEMFDSDLPNCKICGHSVFDADDDVCYYEPPGYVCEYCFGEKAEKVKLEAEAFAEENVFFADELPRFDQADAWSISPDEYKLDRVANTENAYRTRCRHDYTNYDNLIKDLSKDNALDQIMYLAIREKADSLIADEIQCKRLIVDSRDTST